MQNKEMSLQIYQGTGFQRGVVHASGFNMATAPGIHAGGVYSTKVVEDERARDKR